MTGRNELLDRTRHWIGHAARIWGKRDSIASSLVISALVDVLVARGRLTRSEVRELLTEGSNGVSSNFTQMLGEIGASAMIAGLLARYSD